MSNPSCDTTREILLAHDLDAAARNRLLAALQHALACPQCQQAMIQHDAIREALTSDEADGVPAGGWDIFEQRMTEMPHHGRHLRLFPRRYALAAMLLLTLCGVAFYAFRPQRGQPVVSSELTAADVTGPVQAFQEISQVFDGKAQWLVLTGNSSDIGLGNAAIPGADRPLVTRLAVMSGGKVISSADLVIVAGQSAKAKVAMPQGRSIEYLISTHAGQPQRLDFCAELASGGQAIASLATQLDVVGSGMMSAGQISTAFGNYEIRVGLIQWRKPGNQL